MLTKAKKFVIICGQYRLRQSGALADTTKYLRSWRNWQTHKTKDLMSNFSCRFKSCWPHQVLIGWTSLPLVRRSAYFVLWKSLMILQNKKRQACLIAHLPLPFIIGILTTNPSAVLSIFYISFSFSYFLIGGNLYVIIEIFSFYSVVFVCFPSIRRSPFFLARTIDILVLPAIILLQVTLLDVRKGWNRFEVVSFLPLKYVSHHSPIKIVS